MIHKGKILHALSTYLPHVPSQELADAVNRVPGSATVEEGIALCSVLVGLVMHGHPASYADPVDTYNARTGRRGRR